jgi:hypothetical protein
MSSLFLQKAKRFFLDKTFGFLRRSGTFKKNYVFFKEPTVIKKNVVFFERTKSFAYQNPLGFERLDNLRFLSAPKKRSFF